MHPFTFSRASNLEEALAAVTDPATALLAGGTELLNWLKEGIVAPSRVVQINRLSGLNTIESSPQGLRLGALARMSDVAAHPAIKRGYPVISEALLKSASPQLRNMASVGGNLLQRTRCPYFRAETELPCNKRKPGSGCAALKGDDREMAIFGASHHCVATHPSDFAVALAALDAIVRVQSSAGERTLALGDFHRLPGTTPERETALLPGELIVAIEVPASNLAVRSHYLKLRERASYEFALVSAAVGLELEGRKIKRAQVALGGVAPKPWRLTAAEAALREVSIDEISSVRAAVERGFKEAQPLKNNGFKIELATRLVVRALLFSGMAG